MRLSPRLPGPPGVADHEIDVCVTSCGDQVPVIVQMVFGLRASETSARTGDVEPCMISSASWVAGAPGQLACKAAQAGTVMGLGDGADDGEGLGLGLGEGLGDGVGLGEGEA